MDYDDLAEDWADSISMVAYDKLSKQEKQKTAETINRYRERIDFKKWKRIHKKRYEYFLNLLEDS